MSEIRDGASLGHLFARTAQRFAERDAFVSDAGVRWTYAELAERAARVIAVLAAAGLGRGSSLAILAPNKPDVLTATLAAMVMGVRVTALSMLSSLDDQAFILDDAEIDALLLDPSSGPTLEALKAAVPRVGVYLSLGPCPGAQDLLALADAAQPATLTPLADGADIALLAYTGGTTGRPKGVVHTHGSAMAAILMATSEWDWPAEMRILAATPVSHAAGILAYPTFLRGGVFLMMGGFTAAKFAEFVERERVTASFLVPTMIYRLMDDLAPDVSFPTLETIIYGAAPIAEARLRQAIARFGPIFMQLYGQTEAPTCISSLGKSQHDLDDPASLRSCGVPLASLQVALLDDQGVQVAPGERGEICVRGPLVMREYWKRPEETAAALAGGWLHTGDVGAFDERGRLHIVDRVKDMIISGGFNVFPSEIERALGEHPGVEACAVVGLPDPTWGEKVTAAVVRRADSSLEAAEVEAWVRDKKGPVYAPKHVVFLDSLPLTPIGKIDRKALKSALA